MYFTPLGKRPEIIIGLWPKNAIPWGLQTSEMSVTVQFMTIAVKRRHLTIRRWLPSTAVAAEYHGGPRVLIVGCGTIPLPGASEAWRIVNLEVERKAFPNLVLYDGSVFPFGDESFDAALCLDVLEHVQEDDFMLGEIARVLKSGGGTPFSRRRRLSTTSESSNYRSEKEQKLGRMPRRIGVMSAPDTKWVNSSASATTRAFR